MRNQYYTNERSIQILLYLLKANGIRKVIASPGTTNLSLVASMQNDAYFEMYSSVDERSAAYIACGLAAESGEPVVLSCTEATASRNYMSGLTEAFYRKLPILAITSNHGTDLVGHLNAQTIDRSNIPNDIAKISVNIPVTLDKNTEWHNEILLNKAIIELKRNGGGPVHINLASQFSGDFSVQVLPEARVIKRYTVYDKLPELPNGNIGIFVGSHKNFTKEETKIIDTFCKHNNAVVLCDHTSGYNGEYKILFSLIASQNHYQFSFGELDLLIHLGEVSGDYYTQRVKSKHVWRVSEDGELRDTFRKLQYVFEMKESFFFSKYINVELKTNTIYKECIKEYNYIYSSIPDLPFSNIWIAKMLSKEIPENSNIHFGILNSLRSWNFFYLSSNIVSNSNVGGFGIDGILSSLIGSSLADRNKLNFGVIGDLAFFYDLNSLGNHNIGKNLRILLINNGRGTEFKNCYHLGEVLGENVDPFVAAAGHFGNKSKTLVKNYVENLGYEYLSASNKEDFMSVYKTFIDKNIGDKSIVFEVFTDSKNESDALKVIRNLKRNVPKTMKEHVKDILGEKTVKYIVSKIK